MKREYVMVVNTTDDKIVVQNLEKKKYLITFKDNMFKCGDLLIINYPAENKKPCHKKKADFRVTPVLIARAQDDNNDIIKYGSFPM